MNLPVQLDNQYMRLLLAPAIIPSFMRAPMLKILTVEMLRRYWN